MKEITGVIFVQNGNPKVVLNNEDVLDIAVYLPEFEDKFREFLADKEILEDGKIYITYSKSKHTEAAVIDFDEAHHIPIITFVQSYLDGISKP